MTTHAAGPLRQKYTRGIAEFVSGLAYDAIPGEQTQRVKLLILGAFDADGLREAGRAPRAV